MECLLESVSKLPKLAEAYFMPGLNDKVLIGLMEGGINKMPVIPGTVGRAGMTIKKQAYFLNAVKP